PSEESEGAVGNFYFYWSFGYLLLKTCAVSLCAADVFESSRGPRQLLYDVPPESYGVEVQRFLTQVVTDDIVLTGLNFFAVTRTLLLTVAGTIVTYEIVLVQFNNLNESSDRNSSSTSPDLCNASIIGP
ncbi:Gustatory receptor for sugar taste 64f, partial [Gryllus bimaculatus]